MRAILNYARSTHDFHRSNNAQHNLLKKLNIFYPKKSAFLRLKLQFYHSWTRHIDHFICKNIEERNIKLEFCRSEVQVTNSFTKAIMLIYSINKKYKYRKC